MKAPSIRMLTRTKRIVFTIVAVFCGFVFGFVFHRFRSSDGSASLHPTDKGGIGIPALVQEVREELVASDIERAKANLPALFVAKSVDLEISFVAKQSDAAGSKLSLEVIDVDARHDISSEQTQKMTIHLDVQQSENVSIPPSLEGSQK